jgi:hypothetical protein
MRGFGSAIVVLVCLAKLDYGQTAKENHEQPDSSTRMVIILEALRGSTWTAVDPGLVLHQKDRVRFRFKSNFNGYLYVSDRGTSGSYDLLYPGPQTGLDNRIIAGHEYLIPSVNTRFRVAGPSGRDVVYWLVSPLKLPDASTSSLSLHAEEQPALQMSPRCDDALFQARGECIDSGAGPLPNQSRELLPDGSSDAAPNLVFSRQEDMAVVSAAQPLKGPVVYEFYLAHE